MAKGIKSPIRKKYLFILLILFWFMLLHLYIGKNNIASKTTALKEIIQENEYKLYFEKEDNKFLMKKIIKTEEINKKLTTENQILIQSYKNLELENKILKQNLQSLKDNLHKAEKKLNEFSKQIIEDKNSWNFSWLFKSINFYLSNINQSVGLFKRIISFINIILKK